MNWFEQLVGFRETDPDQVRSLLRVEGDRLVSRANGRSFRCGTLETPSLAELRAQTDSLFAGDTGEIRVSEVVADVRELHRAAENDGALFQVASQFNLLEMIGPNVTPERGVGIYDQDQTQGPACAIACGAGTIYRNYLADVDGRIGQTADRQIDCLRDIGDALGNDAGQIWIMRNGYALANESGLRAAATVLGGLSDEALDALRAMLRIGLQWQTDVTLGKTDNVVTQAFCSAVPVAYSGVAADHWEPLARLVLEATYEATLHAALLNREKTGSNRVFLTLVGGGAFGNRLSWIVDALSRAFARMRGTGLDIRIVSYGRATSGIRDLIT